MSTELLQQIAADLGPHLVPLTVEQYHRMIEAQILHDGAPIELIDGLLVHKDRSGTGGDPMTHHLRHPLVITRLLQLLTPFAAKLGHHLRIQFPLELSNVNAPEPDLALIIGPPDRYRQRHPGPGDVHLVVEVSDSSLGFDRTTKQRLYAVAGIPEYWIINFRADVIEVHRQPDANLSRYLQREEFQIGQSLSLKIENETLVIEVNALLN